MAVAKRRVTRRRAQPERALHAHVYRLLQWLKPDCVWFPVPNGATDLGVRLGAILKAQGKVKAGVPDFVFLWGDGSGVIELKVGTGRPSPAQLAFIGECGEHGVCIEIARSLDEVVETLYRWGRIDKIMRDLFLQRKS